ncbi:hypothetical protein FA95DRAFT_1161776 [Auriscalpium vulgare]|uniref:Uncharacterized protein n=1 Tax=Auriscalpium vulgare TaxID=40419 RepID=A0ACB8S9Z6_9AGAM|nr:hypothetical protein FA95DRAFT_1161776 [Auriscalpium vulgare]
MPRLPIPATVSSVLPFTNPLSRTLEEVRRNLDTRRPSLKAELEAARTMDILGPYADPSKIPAHTTISNADTCNPTRLPPELWLRIFALAADVPGLMDPAPATSFPYDPWPALETTQWGALHERYREPGRLAHGTFADRFSIYTNAGLACRYFYALVLPELYACVRVTSLAACEALARTLATSQREGGTPLGACVRVAIFDLSSPRRPFSEYDRAYPPLAAIFRCLPRLHTLHFEVSAREEISWHALSHFPEPVDSALRQMCAPTLRKLHWGEHSVVWPAVVWPAPRDRHALLAAAVGLRSLVYDVRLGGCPCRLPVLPELAELTLGCHALNLWGDGACPTTPLPPLPALRALYWRIQDTRLNDTLRACGHLAARQGPLLRSVVLDTPYYVEAEIVGKALATLRAYCTKLKKLTLVVRDWQQLEAAAKGNMPQSVTRLELRFTIDHPRLQNGFPTPIILFEVLKALEMPNLKVVVLLPDDTLRRWLWANAKSTELDVAAVVKSLPFRVEDYEGRLLSEVWL